MAPDTTLAPNAEPTRNETAVVVPPSWILSVEHFPLPRQERTMTPSSRPTTVTAPATELERAVSALAAGDVAALFSLVQRCGGLLAAALRRAGVDAPDADALDRLVQEAALVVADLAPVRPGCPAVDVVAEAAALVVAPVAGPADDADVGVVRRPRPPSRPAGRALHLVDIENLVGGPSATRSAVDLVWRQYRVLAECTEQDQVHMAADRSLYVRTAFDLGAGIAYHPAVGRDGADNRLLAVAPAGWVTARFDRLVIGSGDHAFAALAASARAAGLRVLAVARPGTLARELRVGVDEVRWLPLDGEVGAAA
jgi:hypothetical protein